MKQAVQTKAEVVLLLRQHQNTMKAFGVKKIGLFGSFVREEQQAKSDVDLLVEFEHGKKTFENFMYLSFFLEDMLKRRIELVTPESLSPYLRLYILKEVEHVTFTN